MSARMVSEWTLVILGGEARGGEARRGGEAGGGGGEGIFFQMSRLRNFLAVDLV